MNLDSGNISRTQEQDEVSGKFIFDILMEGLLPGRYRLDIDGLEKEVFYFDPVLARKNILGILEIFFTVPVSYRFFTGAGKADFKEYALAFQNRKTLWRYIIYNKNGTLMPDPQIRETLEPWTFTEDQPGTFISDKVMPLQENAIAGISLLADAGDASSVLVTNLPNPDVSLIKPDINNISTIYSDVNVYI